MGAAGADRDAVVVGFDGAADRGSGWLSPADGAATSAPVQIRGRGQALLQHRRTDRDCQVGVFMAYRSNRGHALIDRQLYLPQVWTDDRDRCRAAGVPDEVEFAAKVQMARTMLATAFAAGVPAGWVTMDEAVANDSERRRGVTSHRSGLVAWSDSPATTAAAAKPSTAFPEDAAAAVEHIADLLGLSHRVH